MDPFETTFVIVVGSVLLIWYNVKTYRENKPIRLSNKFQALCWKLDGAERRRRKGYDNSAIENECAIIESQLKQLESEILQEDKTFSYLGGPVTPSSRRSRHLLDLYARKGLSALPHLLYAMKFIRPNPAKPDREEEDQRIYEQCLRTVAGIHGSIPYLCDQLQKEYADVDKTVAKDALVFQGSKALAHLCALWFDVPKDTGDSATIAKRKFVAFVEDVFVVAIKQNYDVRIDRHDVIYYMSDLIRAIVGKNHFEQIISTLDPNARRRIENKYSSEIEC